MSKSFANITRLFSTSPSQAASRALQVSRSDLIALVLSLVGILAGVWVSVNIFEDMPHLEDEIAYVWQANVLAEGDLKIPSPPFKESFLVPFVVDHQGYRFGKYPIGWPLLLSVGVRLGLRTWVNPLLGGLAIWLTYRLGKRIFGSPTGLLAAALTAASPFFLMNTGSLLSHPLGLVLSIAFGLTWLDAFGKVSGPRRWPSTLLSALCLGLLVLVRPFSAVAVAFPFALYGLYLLVRGDGKTRLHLLAMGGLTLALALLHFLWQYAVTGDPLLNPYTLWWPYDKVGFGPGVGVTETGHTLRQAWVNTRYSLQIGWRDLFGWGNYSWIFLPFGLWAARRDVRGFLLALVYPSLVVFYLAYWVSSWLFGPRYFYEGLFSLTLISAAGIVYLAGWPLGDNQPGARPAWLNPGSLFQSVFRRA
ncbi:MAG: hypothetical protein EHM70_11970, partial [Chloroflexota bacterium]